MQDLNTKEDIIKYLEEELTVAKTLKLGDDFYDVVNKGPRKITEEHLERAKHVLDFVENSLLPILKGKLERKP